MVIIEVMKTTIKDVNVQNKPEMNSEISTDQCKCNVPNTKISLHIMYKYSFQDFMLNAAFNNISVISRWSVLSIEEIGVSGENHQHSASH